MPLTATFLRHLKPTDSVKKYFDGGGLYLQVDPNGSMLWRLSFRIDRKPRLMSFGRYPEVSLQMAREQRQKAKRLLHQGIDPVAHRRGKREERRAQTENTFELIAAELIAKQTKEGLSNGTLKKKRWLLDMANADFGTKPIREITPAMVLKTLRKVEARGTYEVAKRLRSTIGQVFRYAVSSARAESDPTYSLQGALTSPPPTHMAAVTDKEGFRELVRKIWDYHGNTSTLHALRLLVLLYPRPGELRRATWSEFDFEKRRWTIPPEHEKNRRTHVKPLSNMVIKLLNDQRKISGNLEFVFPGASNLRKPMSENTLNQALHRLGYKGRHTSHGFRSSASSLLNECGLWDADAIEVELSHIERDQSRRPYHRARYKEERVEMAEWWSQQIEAMVAQEQG